MMIDISAESLEILIKELERKTRELEDKLAAESQETFLLFEFFSERPDEELIRWIEFLYTKWPEGAKKAVSAFHDDRLDLSRIECCKDDFAPWKL